MANWNYRKRISIAPGIKLNLSKKGISTTLGVPGSSINIGKSGTYLNTGIAGTGIYKRQKLGKGKTNNKTVINSNVITSVSNQNSIYFAVLMVVVFTMGLLLILIVTESYLINILGYAALVYSSIGLVIFFIRCSKRNIYDNNTKLLEYKKIEISIPTLKNIDEKFTEKLLSNFALECYFHFRRPLLSKEQYDETTFSIAFRKAFYLYEGYKKQWENIFHHFTFEMKTHQLLIQLLDEDFIETNGGAGLEEDFYASLSDRLIYNLNEHEKVYYETVRTNGCTMRDFINWYKYKDVWMINKYESGDIERKLREDLLYRQESCLNNTLLWHGGLELWNSSIPKLVEEYEKD